MTPGGDFVEAAKFLKTLSHPLRLKIVCGLMGESANLSRIARDLGIPISTASQHLAVLRRAGILVETRRGVEVLFEVKDGRVPGVLDVLCGHGAKRPKLPRWSWAELGA